MIYKKFEIEQEWQVDNLTPFNELIVSWNAIRPKNGCFHFFLSIKIQTWSPWYPYASWGSHFQSSFSSTDSDHSFLIYQDTLEIINSKKATGFRLKILTDEEASLTDIYGIYVYTNGEEINSNLQFINSKKFVSLEIPQISQMTISHNRCKDLCSPTSVTAVTRFLSKNFQIDPIIMAKNVWDKGFDIFGNWVFNIAEAANLLGTGWHCWVARLNSFEDIYQSLVKNIPVIVSVRGPLIGSAQTYSHGHLLTVVGFDPLQQFVLCMDPAFPTNGETSVSYPLLDFENAWNKRGKIAYLFEKN